jgi:hypothetical protein
MLKKILITLAVIIVVFLIVVAMQPSEFRVTRSTTISAPPGAVFLGDSTRGAVLRRLAVAGAVAVRPRISNRDGRFWRSQPRREKSS